MSFHKGYIIGILVCFLICAILIYYFYPRSVEKVCNPVIDMLGWCLNEKNNLVLSKQNSIEKKDFKYKELFKKLENISISCPKSTYEILKMNEKDIDKCLAKKYVTFLGVKDLGTELKYNYLYKLDDGLYVLSYRIETTYFLTFAKKNYFDRIYDKNGNIIIFANPEYDLRLQRELLEKYILDILRNYNYSFVINENILNDSQPDDISKYCIEINYVFLDPKSVGKETLKELAYDILINRGYLNKINKKMNLFAVRINYKDKNYKIKMCFGKNDFQKVFNKNTTHVRSLKELSEKLKGNTPLETAYNVLKWVDENIKYDDEKAKEIIEGKNPPLRTPEQVLKDKKGICSEYSMFIDSILLNNNITPYYIIIKYKNKNIDHAVAGIEYNGTYYILDQHLPLMDLKHYIVSSHVCNNDSFKEMVIYKIDKDFNRKLVKKITKFNYSIEEDISYLNKIRIRLIGNISKKYNLKFVNNLFKNLSVNVKKGIIKELRFYCLYPKIGNDNLLDLNSRYFLDNIEKENYKEFEVAKYFDINITKQGNDIDIKVPIGY